MAWSPVTDATPDAATLPAPGLPLDYWLSDVELAEGWDVAPGPPVGVTGLDPYLQVTVHTLDSDTGGPTAIVHGFGVPGFVALAGDPAKAFYDWLDGVLCAVSRHEVHEMYKVAGRRWNDPHRDGNSHLYD